MFGAHPFLPVFQNIIHKTFERSSTQEFTDHCHRGGILPFDEVHRVRDEFDRLFGCESDLLRGLQPL